MRFTLYPIYGLASPWDDDGPFDTRSLPFLVAEGVSIEAVSDRFREGTFDLWRTEIGRHTVEDLETVAYALVHRYDPRATVECGEVIGEGKHAQRSAELVRLVAACLRLIRPMRQRALTMQGNVREEDGSFDVTGFDVPMADWLEVPEVQKLFTLRNRDAADLRAHAPEFFRAMRGEYWKFRMAVQFHELGHFQSQDWKARYLLWCSAIESIYTSHNWKHQGTLVATSRIKWFIGEDTSIYAPGDLSNLLADPQITVGQIVNDLYNVRNFLAHGDRLPDRFFTEIPRQGFTGGVPKLEALLEAASFIIRTRLLKILHEGLLNDFADAAPAEDFFGAQNLTRPALQAAAQRAGDPTAQVGVP